MPTSDESFATALDAAISDAGLTLDRLREHLAARGVTVSRSALAYWRLGRSRPEREASLHAVSELERVLGLAPGTLVRLLASTDRRCLPRERRAPLLERRRLWPSVRPLSLELDSPPENQLRLWSVHDELTVDDDHQERLLRVRLVAEAAVAGVTRMLVYYQTEDLARVTPRVAAVRHGRLGRVRSDGSAGLFVVELVFDRVLAAGDVAAVDYDLAFEPGRPVDGYHRRLTRPTPMYTCQVRFGRSAPRSLYRFQRRDLAAPRRKTQRLRLSAEQSATVAARDVPVGIIGLNWTW
ncbi:XRE family transcriptional regulator [Amycolatopsis sp. OK19-0408]|uniref:XRE family transcriptional regulator n=1 Tax=Amycolatopsis iheyensis TaxID=2945988 RepID=A0A9X2NHD0_9PSEU|nr:XRE family transcriptional regulator [Amycolatopsis iheyensis]MCR6487812.1 XRE family transcriptional regulator [Amycolatopsis iheyensis]